MLWTVPLLLLLQAAETEHLECVDTQSSSRLTVDNLFGKLPHKNLSVIQQKRQGIASVLDKDKPALFLMPMVKGAHAV